MIKLSRIALFVAVISMISCGSTSSSNDGQDSNVSISGKLDNAAGKQLILMRFANNQPVMLDTVDLTASGEFEININVPQTDFYQLAASQQNGAILILSPGENVKLSGDANDLRSGLSISGSKNTELLKSFYEKARENGIKSQEMRQKINALPQDQAAEKQELIDEFNEFNKEFTNYTKEFIEDNATSPAVFSALGSLNMETDFEYYVKARDGLKKRFHFLPITRI